MMTFDDEYASVYSEAFKNIMEPLGVRGTFYVSTSYIDGTNDPPYVTAAQLQEMDAAGWSIANHTVDGADLTTFDQATATAKVAGAKSVLDSLGLTGSSMHLSYPNGGYNATVLAATQAAGMLTGRRIFTEVPPYAFPPCDPDENYQIWSTLRLGSGETIAEAIDVVDEAIAGNKIVLFYGHKIVDPANDTTKWEPWRLKALIDYCVNKNLPFITIKDFYDLQSGPLTITRTPA